MSKKQVEKRYVYDQRFEDALKAEKVNGKAADTARAIYAQESGSGKNTATSNHNAIGGMQIKEKTFKDVADKGWSINNPIHNMQAGIRYVKDLFQKSGGNSDLTAMGYYGGPGAIDAGKKGIAWRDRKNKYNPTTFEYAKDIKGIMNKMTPGKNAYAADSKIDQPYKATPKLNVVDQARQVLKNHPELSRAKPQAPVVAKTVPNINLPGSSKAVPQIPVKQADPNGMLVAKKDTPPPENNLFGFKGPVKDVAFGTFSSYDNLSKYGKVKINEEAKPVVQPKALDKIETPVNKIYNAPSSITGEKVVDKNVKNTKTDLDKPRIEMNNELNARAKFKKDVLGLEKDKQAELRGEGKQIPRVIKETPVVAPKQAIPKATVKDIPKSKEIEVTAPKVSTPTAKVVESKTVEAPKELNVTTPEQVNKFTEQLQPVAAVPIKETVPAKESIQAVPAKVVEPKAIEVKDDSVDNNLEDDYIPEPAQVSKPVDSIYTPGDKGFENKNSVFSGSKGRPGTAEEGLLPNTTTKQEDYFKELDPYVEPKVVTNPIDSIFTPDNQRFANRDNLFSGSIGKPDSIEQSLFPNTTRTPEDYFKEAIGLKPVLGREPLSTIQEATNPVDSNYYPGSQGFENRNSILPGSIGRPQAIERILAPATSLPPQDYYSDLNRFSDNKMFENKPVLTNNIGLSDDMTEAEFAANHKQVQDWAYKNQPIVNANNATEYIPQADSAMRPDINIPDVINPPIAGEPVNNFGFKTPNTFEGALGKPANTEQSVFPNTTTRLEDYYKEVQGVAAPISQGAFSQTINPNAGKTNVPNIADPDSTRYDTLGDISVRAKADPYQEFASAHERTQPVRAADLNYIKNMADLGKVQIPDFMTAISRIGQPSVQMNAMPPQSTDMRNLLMQQMRKG